ncbi:hypothetical protein [Winogradskyella tangerina]|uniref:hypothetical protein n=1 Tax=Winogradskyella tangerina TaxID=2023240 RepID=UPI000DBE4E5B|nr:hypothetical protein [Winogradskyella tangerina]
MKDVTTALWIRLQELKSKKNLMPIGVYKKQMKELKRVVDLSLKIELEISMEQQMFHKNFDEWIDNIINK